MHFHYPKTGEKSWITSTLSGLHYLRHSQACITLRHSISDFPPKPLFVLKRFGQFENNTSQLHKTTITASTSSYSYFLFPICCHSPVLYHFPISLVETGNEFCGTRPGIYSLEIVFPWILPETHKLVFCSTFCVETSWKLAVLQDASIRTPSMS
jgi:hypothetical protein